MTNIRQYVLENLQAVGDSLMFSCAVRDLHKQLPGEFITGIATRYADIWQGNPYNKQIDRSVESGHLRIGYSTAIHNSNFRTAHFSTGFCQDLSEKLGVRINLTDMRPDVYLTDQEKDPVNRQVKEPYWIIMAGGKSDFTNKIWSPVYYQQTIDMLKNDIRIVQVGGAGHLHKPLTGVLDLVGKTTLRQFMCLVHHCQGIICPITSGMHLAAAFNRPAVVIGGGREGWWWEAYTRNTWAVNVPGSPCPPEFVDHTYLHTIDRLPCCTRGGCWRNGVADKPDKAKNCKCVVNVGGQPLPKCLEMIGPQMVVEAVRRYMNKISIPLENVPGYLRPPLFTETLQATPHPVYIHPPKPKPVAFGLRRHPKRRWTPPRMLPKETGQLRVVPQVVAPVNVTPVVQGVSHIRPLTICVLLYGNFLNLAQRCLRSIYSTVNPKLFELRLGMNAVSTEVAQYVDSEILPYGNVKVYRSETNIFKYPMMRRMFEDMADGYVMWFDDDSHVVDPQWLTKLDGYIARNPDCQMVGKRYFMHLKEGQVNWIKQATWYTGRDVERRKGAAVAYFNTGGWWMARTSLIKQLDWPDRRIQNNGGDSNLGAACWQNNVQVHEHYDGIMISDAPRRGASQTHPGL